MRIFAALVPPTWVVDDLEDFLVPRLEAGRAAGLRWSEPTQWHLTLAFAADAGEDRLDDLADRLASAARRRTCLTGRLAGGGALPDVGRARILHASLALPAAQAEELGRLARAVRTAFGTSGIEVDGTRFSPHLTLARLSRARDVTPWVRLLDGYAGPEHVLDRVVLIASHLSQGPRGRPRHEVLAEAPLGQLPT